MPVLQGYPPQNVLSMNKNTFWSYFNIILLKALSKLISNLKKNLPPSLPLYESFFYVCSFFYVFLRPKLALPSVSFPPVTGAGELAGRSSLAKSSQHPEPFLPVTPLTLPRCQPSFTWLREAHLRSIFWAAGWRKGVGRRGTLLSLRMIFISLPIVLHISLASP